MSSYWIKLRDIRPIINLKLTIAKLFPTCSKMSRVENWRTVSEKEINIMGKKFE